MAALLTSILKTSSTKSAKPRKSEFEVGNDKRAGCNRSELYKNEIDNVEVDGGKVRDNEVSRKGQKTSKSKNLSKFKKTVELDFLIPRARLAFIKLR